MREVPAIADARRAADQAKRRRLPMGLAHY